MASIVLKDNGKGCLECISHKADVYGYPRMSGNRVFRHLYIEHHGQIPKGSVIMHTCDNRLCCNVDHLRLGTYRENILDRDTKHRQAFGTRNGRSKLREEEVLLIYHDRETPKMHLAKKYGVDPRVIRDIQNGFKWLSVTGADLSKS